MLYLKTTELNQKKSTIIECLVDIIIVSIAISLAGYGGQAILRLLVAKTGLKYIFYILNALK